MGVWPDPRDNALHPTEKYYPLRPELAESTAMLYAATSGAVQVGSLDMCWNLLGAALVLITCIEPQGASHGEH